MTTPPVLGYGTPRHDPLHRFEWNESLAVRRCALGADYRPYLLKSLGRWSAGIGGPITLLILVIWIRGERPWFNRFDLVLTAAMFGGTALLRLLMELLPRTITVKGRALFVFHSKTNQSGYFDEVVVVRVTEEVFRLEFRNQIKPLRAGIFGARRAQTDDLIKELNREHVLVTRPENR